MASKYKMGARIGKYKLEARAGDQANGREPGNTNNRFLRDFEIVDDHLADTKHQKVTVCPPINAWGVY